MDLFSPLERPAPSKTGQANGEFLAHLAMLDPAKRRHVTPADFPHANPALVKANVTFQTGGHHA